MTRTEAESGAAGEGTGSNGGGNLATSERTDSNGRGNTGTGITEGRTE